MRREAARGIAADNLLTGPGSESVLGRLRTTFLCLLNGSNLGLDPAPLRYAGCCRLPANREFSDQNDC